MQAILLLVLLAFKLTTYSASAWYPSHLNLQTAWEDDTSDEKLLHLTIDEHSGQKRVYVGAVNKIYQLSSDLKLEAQANMGPAQDNYDCPVTRHCPHLEPTRMNYYNKALVIYTPDSVSHQIPAAATGTTAANTFPSPFIAPASATFTYLNSQQQQQQPPQPSSSSLFSATSSYVQQPPSAQQSFLISCGTLYQGSCALHNLDNITNYEIPANESVVANSPNASTVVFLAPGPAKPPEDYQPPVLYVGASNTGLGRYNSEVPAVSSRSLQPDSMFDFAASNVVSGTRLTLNTLSRDRFPITYIHGFSSKGFSYFVTVQRKSTNLPKPFLTKLVRICQNDLNYHSYVEVALVCRSDNNTDYNLAQAAYVGYPGSNLAKSLGIKISDEVLYVIFAKSKDHKRDIHNEPSQQSALCIYSLPNIRRIFTQNIQHCFNGNGQQGLDFINRVGPCTPTQVQIREDFCGMDVNNLISGLIPIETSPVIEYKNTSLTAVAVSPTNDFTVAYLGTASGHLKRLIIEHSRQALEYSNSLIDPQRKTAINADMKFDRQDKNADFLYVMNDKKVYLIKVQECNTYKTCTDCLGAFDPHCGWCSIENRCSVRNSCAEGTQDNMFWLSYTSGKCTTVPNPAASSILQPSIVSIIPSKGPRSGGTRLELWGMEMNAGSKAEIFVGDSPCQIIERRSEKAECITGEADQVGQREVVMRFDNGEKTFKGYSFLYVEDPEVDIVTSQPTALFHNLRLSATHAPPKGIPAGGITIYVKGKNFSSIKEPRFYVLVGTTRYNSSCQVDNATEMTCLSPFVPENRLSIYRPSPEEPVELDYGFIMDNVERVHSLATRRDNPLPMFLMYSNPEYRPFPEEIKFYKSDYLTINGSNLDRASTENDILVRIGSGYCNVTSLSRTQLTCKPPPIQPEALNWRGQLDSNQLPDVVVTVGHTLNFTIGKLSYDSYEGFTSLLPKSVIFGLAGGAGFLLCAIVLILIAYRRKAIESSRVVKTMQEQMDVLEMKVASEAKQAFTELQTEMTDLTDDLEHGGIPYLDYRIYTMKVLFPNQSDHPVLSEFQVDPKVRPNFEKGLASFGQLISNKTFLLLFIRTLESNKYFSMRDRVNVASLIMVTLQSRMEYCTDILKTMLADLIEKSMESRSHPKLLLRRTESVAEKMLSSWFTFLLYKFLRECAGEPLFLLYQAIKHQVNKGPVDVITNEARCSLSEEKLIRQSVDYKPMTIYVSISPQTAYLSGVDPNLQTENLETPVKVLDCDTISQVKEKAIDAIYKSTPYSQRPSLDNLDLEWRATQASRVLMSDEDHTTKVEGNWKRLNTLAHYRLPENASLSMVTKSAPSYNLSMMDEKHRYETLSHFGFSKNALASPISRPTSPLHINGTINGISNIINGNNNNPNGALDSECKYWHLLRHPNNDYRGGERSGKMVSEIYLTRLLATKGTLQRFVDDLFETIFSTARLSSSLPIAIKYMFDFLDDQARGHGKFIAIELIYGPHLLLN